MNRRYASPIKNMSEHPVGLAENEQGYYTETEPASWLAITLPNIFPHIYLPFKVI